MWLPQLLDKVTIEAGEVVKIFEGRLWVAWLEMKFLEMEFRDPKDCLSLPLPQTSSYLTRPPYESVTMWKYLTARNGSGLS